MNQGKGKGKGLKGGPAQKHLHSRISYLYQAATYLADATRNQVEDSSCSKSIEQVNNGPEKHDQSSTIIFASAETESSKVPLEPRNELAGINRHNLSTAKDLALSSQLLTHLRAISLKSVIRITPDIKHSICKRCDVLLIAGSSATVEMENKSRGGRKPRADVLVVTCVACGAAKRFPVGAKRQLKRQYRPNGSEGKTKPRPKDI